MYKVRQALRVTVNNFSSWRRTPRILITFSLAFILCYLLSDKVVRFARDYETTMQLVEAFIWTFGDSNSILLASLLLMLLFADMPFINSGTALYLVRTDRKTWITGQVLYIILATTIYMAFILVSTSLICMQSAFIGNKWSETAAMLGYSGAGKAIALPAFVKTLEMSYPYQSMVNIFLLMLLYVLLMVFVMLVCNLKFGQAGGVIGVFSFSLYGFLMNPQLIKTVLKLPDDLFYRANVLFGWISPLNHATYHMHNFGFDLLPSLWQTYAIFAVLIALLYFVSLRTIRRYSFKFTGTEG